MALSRKEIRRPMGGLAESQSASRKGAPYRQHASQSASQAPWRRDEAGEQREMSSRRGHGADSSRSQYRRDDGWGGQWGTSWSAARDWDQSS